MRTKDVLLGVVLVLGLGALGVVLGALVGRFYGEQWGAHAGHGMGDIVYVFLGALLGGAARLGGGGAGALAWRRRARTGP